jgi:hypothetical protein
MTSVAQGTSIGPSAPVLVAYTIHEDHVLGDVDAAGGGTLEFVVDDETGTQVFPVTGRESVDVGANRLGLGYYAPTWTVDASQEVGRYRITWYYKQTATSDERSYYEDFEVIADVFDAYAESYALVADLRDEGIDETAVPDARLHRLLCMASRFVDSYTGRWFAPRHATLRFDGSGTRALLLDAPICAVGLVALDYGSLGTVLTYEPSGFRVYDRHLSQRLADPDDRESPRVEALGHEVGEGSWSDIASFRFPLGRQNVRVTGVFGYTDPLWRLPASTDPIGRTPHLITHATKLLTIRNMHLLNPADRKHREDRERSLARWRLVAERSDNGSEYRLATDQVLRDHSAAYGHFTGDPAIDQILAQYHRPTRLGAV